MAEKVNPDRKPGRPRGGCGGANPPVAAAPVRGPTAKRQPKELANGGRSLRARGRCAPGGELYRPGDLVKYRTGGELAGVLKAVLAAAVKAGGDVFVVTAVVREEWLHGSFVLYRVACGPRAFLVNPAAVVRIDPPAPPAEEEQRADGAAEYQAANPPAANPPAALEWHAISSNVGRTADGRFEIQTSARNLHVARDLWTGEQTGGLANRYSAEEWCRARLAAAPLTWVEYGGGWRVSGADHQYQVYADMAGFAGCDRRTGTEAHFDASADALRWCEVRAACRVEPGGVLVYERPDEVPF